MSENKDKQEELLLDEDLEYEKELAEKERKRREEEERLRAEKKAKREKQKRDAEKQRDKQIAKEKLELLQLKNGVLDEKDATIKEEHTEAVKLTGKAWLANFWYHYKFMIIVVFLSLCVLAFLIYTTVTRKKADLTVILLCDNGLAQRTDEVEKFFEKYTDDVDGNGYVHVAVINIPISDHIDAITASGNSQSFYANVQTGDGMIVLTDSNVPDNYMELMDPTLGGYFKDNEYIDEQGFSFDSKIMAEELGFEYMPNDVHMSIRYPTQTMSLSKKEAQKLYDESFVVFERIVNDVTERCRETNDPGLETEPADYKLSEEDASSAG
ncbi:MAG: hypothetical protein IJ737_04150 [Ruminococcus sp.]|nr:hypothetical protein [Ruminococcus sp.]